MKAKTARDLLNRIAQDSAAVLDYIQGLEDATDKMDGEETVPADIKRSCERAAEVMFDLRTRLENDRDI